MQQISVLWGILERLRVGPVDVLFALVGNSLIWIQISDRVSQDCGVEYPCAPLT
ncbi:hypothetical protein [Streptomyces albipurpureus]|uniref:Uncharacterized protein n=1 Tax=Streptomyces albipurpureus TaxID=2897419 RepID=A0ABT0UZ49_9ACTN|nr:hypothetical protein [Streptomyces sp. CWNU-1]MCM2393749.1 hypothetical protein [Streptomyces sp. CWNU-1]